MIIGNQIEAHRKDIEGYLDSIRGQQPNPFAVLVLLVKRYASVVEKEYRLCEDQSSSLERITGLGSLGLFGPHPQDPKNFNIRRAHFFVGNLRAAAFGINFQIELISFLQINHVKYLSLMKLSGPNQETKGIDEDLESLKCVIMWQKLHYQHFAMQRAQAQLDAVLLYSKTLVARIRCTLILG